jgi:flagellar protein FliS|tara:strand:- start:7 stop:426 length:420 start_codon:yes stop_codon:yes gene_type:complete
MRARFNRGTNAYRNVQTTAAATYANSIELTQMLFSALLESLAEAEGHMDRKDFEKKASSLSRANKILLGLQGSLDFEKGKELSVNLYDIYEYSIRRLLHASIKNDLAVVKEIKSIISEIDGAWQVLPAALANQSIQVAS